MAFSSIMVILDASASDATVLKVARDVACRSKANMLGLCAQRVVALLYTDAFIEAEAALEKETFQLSARLTACEEAFRAAFKDHDGALAWWHPEGQAALSETIAAKARNVDLVITAVQKPHAFDDGQHLRTDDLIMQAGRPIILVPGNAAGFDHAHILVAWKDTREARRAITDALPLLREADRVTLVEIVKEGDEVEAERRLDEVVNWLAGHDVKAKTNVVLRKDTDAYRLYTIAQDLKAGLIVAGAYGHTRLREWTFGGVTHDLLLNPPCLTLLSH